MLMRLAAAGTSAEAAVVSSNAPLCIASNLLQLRDTSETADVLARILTHKTIVVGGSEISSPLNVEQAQRVHTPLSAVLSNTHPPCVLAGSRFPCESIVQSNV